MNWICKYCGEDTSNVDYDYLDGHNHLSCVLEDFNSKLKKMKIKNWDKIRGFTYKGLTIVNPIYNADETKYMADVLNLNLPSKPKWELVVLTPGHKWKAVDDEYFEIMIWDDMKQNVMQRVTKDKIKSLSSFRQIFETMADELISKQKQMKFKAVSGPTNFNMGISSSMSI